MDTREVDPMEDSSGSSPTAEVPDSAGWWLLLAAGSALFVVVAIVLEVLGGSYANSPVPDWAEVVPIGWPRAVRVVWWVGVAAAAAGFRLGAHRLGFRQRPLVVALSVVPFLAFATGIAMGAGWSTWH